MINLENAGEPVTPTELKVLDSPVKLKQDTGFEIKIHEADDGSSNSNMSNEDSEEIRKKNEMQTEKNN